MPRRINKQFSAVTIMMRHYVHGCHATGSRRIGVAQSTATARLVAPRARRASAGLGVGFPGPSSRPARQLSLLRFAEVRPPRSARLRRRCSFPRTPACLGEARSRSRRCASTFKSIGRGGARQTPRHRVFARARISGSNRRRAAARRGCSRSTVSVLPPHRARGVGPAARAPPPMVVANRGSIVNDPIELRSAARAVQDDLPGAPGPRSLNPRSSHRAINDRWLENPQPFASAAAARRTRRAYARVRITHRYDRAAGSPSLRGDRELGSASPTTYSELRKPGPWLSSRLTSVRVGSLAQPRLKASVPLRRQWPCHRIRPVALVAPPSPTTDRTPPRASCTGGRIAAWRPTPPAGSPASRRRSHPRSGCSENRLVGCHASRHAWPRGILLITSST